MFNLRTAETCIEDFPPTNWIFIDLKTSGSHACTDGNQGRMQDTYD
jgi:hypothetical protein